MRRILKLYYAIFAVVFCLLLSGCEDTEENGFQEISLEELDEEGTSGEKESTVIENRKIFVHVCGQVKNPGVYELDEGSRVFEVIKAAGGMTKEAAADCINQAAVLLDGQQIYVSSKDEMTKAENEAEGMSDGKININRASKEELMKLPGIGESKADAIVRYREENRYFENIEEIMEIEGIKEGVFRKIEGQITVS